MINDILFCLLGYTGGVFIDSQNSFTINETITCISQSEKEILKRIGQIGFKYKILKDFVNDFNELFTQNLMKTNTLYNEKEKIDTGLNDDSKLSTSAYLSPICYSIQEFLKDYERDIQELESQFYNNLNLTGSEIISKLDHYVAKFDKIYLFLQYICQNNLMGGELLNFLYENTINGDPQVRRIFKQLFINTNKMLINYITNWIINGTLSNEEFFILSANNYLIKENTNVLNNLYNTTSNIFELKTWNTNFYIEYLNIPIYLPHNLAEDILFVGKAMKVLSSNKNNEEDKIPFTEISIFYTTLQKLSDIVFNENEQINIINVELFSKIVNLIKSCAGKYLWKLVISKKDFLSHLNAVRNIFLTFNGEFYFNFINKIKGLLNMSFDKNIEKEINDVHFKNSMKEVFNIDTDSENARIYTNFKIKLISTGFSYQFDKHQMPGYLEHNEVSFLGSISFDSISNTLRFMNTVYKNQGGALWSLQQFDIDEEFIMSTNFNIKNYSKGKENEILSTNTPRRKTDVEFLRTSLIKGRRGFDNNNEGMDVETFESKRDNKVVISYIMHVAKSLEFKTKQPFSFNDLNHYFNFQFTVKYDLNEYHTRPQKIEFSLRYVNKVKKIILNNDNFSSSYRQISDFEIEIFSKNFIAKDSKAVGQSNYYTPIDMDFLKNDKTINLQFAFKENYCSIYNDTKSLNFAFPFSINQMIPKDKRTMLLGILIGSEKLDVMVDFYSWDFHCFSGEIYNENSNLILINYEPSWPHNFIFNENTIKMYNYIFNLIFPLKTNLILLNQLWIEKKKIAKKENPLLRLIDSIHAEFVTFLQNLISFFMFDIVDIKYKNFYQKLESCKDFEQIINYHEEFLGEVIVSSFVKSKKIMRIIFDLLLTTRKFYNMVEMFVSSCEIDEALDFNVFRDNMMDLRNEFREKKNSLIDVFHKIKNSKYFAIISQLLTKIDYEISY
jgi:hypothetical protein